MKTILVPLDFSEHSGNALDYAAEIAAISKSKLILLHVYHVPVMATETPFVIPSWEEIEAESMRLLKKSERHIRKKFGLQEVECICRTGFAVEEIIQQYMNNSIGLVVMGMKGSGTAGEKLLGSTAVSLIKNSSCPVLVINEQVKFRSIKKIVMACDCEDVIHNSVLEPLKEFVKIFHSKILVLNVVKESSKMPSLKHAAAIVQIESRLEGTNHSFHFIESKDATEGINKFVQVENADMIAVIPHHHNLFETILNPRNSVRMAFHASVPLLALKE